MTTADILVLAGGTGLIAFIVWFFFGGKEGGEARVAMDEGKQKQEVTVVVEGAYSPSEILVKKGMPVEITFDRRESGDCSEWVVFGNGQWKMDNGKMEKEIKAKLAAFAKTKVEFTPMETGEFPFTCGMGMLHGKLIVTD